MKAPQLALLAALASLVFLAGCASPTRGRAVPSDAQDRASIPEFHAIRSWADAKLHADTERFAAFHRALLERGVYLPPSQFEAWFLSSAHGEAEIDATIAAARDAFASLG